MGVGRPVLSVWAKQYCAANLLLGSRSVGANLVESVAKACSTSQGATSSAVGPGVGVASTHSLAYVRHPQSSTVSSLAEVSVPLPWFTS